MRSRTSKLESDFKLRLRDDLERLFPGCIILKNDANSLQGVPDMMILFRDRWAVLEVKASADADIQPNQPYYVALMNEMSFGAFIYPENKEEVLNDLQLAFGTRRPARISKR